MVLKDKVMAVQITSEDYAEVKRLAKLEGKTISKYVRDRTINVWSNYELESMGFGIVLELFRKKGYPDEYIKKFVGDMIRMLQDIPMYDKGYERRMDLKREQMMQEGLLD